MVDFIYYSVTLSQIELPQQSDIISYIPDKVETWTKIEGTGAVTVDNLVPQLPDNMF